MTDMVNHPPHYTSHPAGVECIQISEHMPHNLGAAIGYIWRCDLKGEPVTDLEKAAWHILREVERRKKILADAAVVLPKRRGRPPKALQIEGPKRLGRPPKEKSIIEGLAKIKY